MLARLSITKEVILPPSFSTTTEEMYGQLSKEAHKHGEGITSIAETYLNACELVLLLILQNRKVSM